MAIRWQIAHKTFVNDISHTDISVSSKAMKIMNFFVNYLFERIAAEASNLAHYNKRSTITSQEI